MPPSYPFPWKIGFKLLRDAVILRSRSARADSTACIQTLSPPPKIIQPENIPASGPCLLVTNHYSRPGFQAWWIALGINAAVPVEVHWLMTAAWTFPESRLMQTFTPMTRWLFSRVARVYGFTTTPPMPPDPHQVETRASSVRRALTYARQAVDPVMAIAPEGSDRPGGVLGVPPSGVGRFIYRLEKHCQRIVPVGVYEDGEVLCIRFGEAFTLDVNADYPVDHIDRQVSTQVMMAIARQVPARLRGDYKQVSEYQEEYATHRVAAA